ncbi:dihydroxyacetone kinase phosphoryl donor subunit DhaM [Liquorilactobacillus cacaonum]|uniref:phosphoenolpyruvate--glycerone phosphotransferase n=1 Tax=Liquorilactobacillus cacaonum DSM 21116 TaxID=1423729 RepID=A0A0R2CVL7_9LACO|nr:dihydroxyacetone kinase phosphoryl donor subunit DhaM [Liquorilactobacillus cacaonum]KRM92121.1 hypothetical protein FC80_GL000304 [Liquorilactobacillus cacaonum DSM 21116]
MKKEYGIVIVSHVPEVAQGIPKLLEQVAKNVSITFAGGTDDNEIGTSANKIMEAFESNEAKKLLAFYDLGSAKMNLELAMEMSEKKVNLYDTALVEGAYTAATLLEADVLLKDIEQQLEALKIK